MAIYAHLPEVPMTMNFASAVVKMGATRETHVWLSAKTIYSARDMIMRGNLNIVNFLLGQIVRSGVMPRKKAIP